jgi:hypothetical protein
MHGGPERRQGRPMEDLHLLLPPHDPPCERGGPQQHLDMPRELLRVVLHEHPCFYFSIARTQRLILQANAAFSQVMEKLQSYQARVTLNFKVSVIAIVSQIYRFALTS